MAAGLVRLLWYGDPVLSSDNKVFLELRRWRRQAEYSMSRQEYDQATTALRHCLQFFGKNLPTSTEIWLATLWQFIRQSLHRVYIGRIGKWLSRWFVDKTERQLAETSAMELAIVYQHLLCIQLSQGRTNAISYLALSSVNYAEAAQNSIPPALLADIYVNAALCFKQSYVPFMLKYFLGKARMILTMCTVPPKLKWLMTDDGARFFMSQKWGYGVQGSAGDEFTTQSNKVDPLSYAAKAYRRYLMGQNLKLLTEDPHMPTVLEVARNIVASAEIEAESLSKDSLCVSCMLEMWVWVRSSR